MVVLPQNKVCLILDFHEWNEYVDANSSCWRLHTKTEWWKKCCNISVLDLWNAYLQLHVHKSLRPYKTVIIEVRRYCLTLMCLGLNVVSSIMRVIMDAVLSNNEIIRWTPRAYIDDIYINENVASAGNMKQHLVNFGLVSKKPKRLKKDSALALGLQVWRECNTHWWKWGLQHALHSNYIVCSHWAESWLGTFQRWMAAAFIKRRAVAVMTSWYNQVDDTPQW